MNVFSIGGGGLVNGYTLFSDELKNSLGLFSQGANEIEDAFD